MARKIFTGLLLAITPIILPAQSPSLDQEKALIKSWGLQLDSSGYLRFTASEKPAKFARERWNPDLSAYQPKAQVSQRDDSIAPLVVSAKNAK